MFLFGKKNKLSPEERRIQIMENMKANSKEMIMPLWAISNAANECVKHKIASDKSTEEKSIISTLLNEGYTIVNARNYGKKHETQARRECCMGSHCVWRGYGSWVE